jgi:uncharacterized cupin superfamily protein
VTSEEDDMEPKPGVFITRTSTDDWSSDPEVPGTEMHELVHADGVHAGLSRYTSASGPITWTPERREVALILEGSVRIEFGDGTDVSLGVGDLFTVPPGLETTWHISPPFKEIWVLAD